MAQPTHISNQLSNVVHILGGQFWRSGWSLQATPRNEHATALRCHIGHVAGMRAEEQMIGIAAASIVAMVADE